MKFTVSKKGFFFLQLAALVFFIGVWFLWGPAFVSWVNDKMESLKGRIVVFLEEKAGRKIRFSSISPSVLQFVEIRDLELLPAVGTGPALVTFSNLKIHFSLWALLNNNMEGLVREIELENTTLSLDTKADEDLFRFIREFLDKSPQGLQTPRIAFSGHNLDLRVSDAGRVLHLDDLFFRFEDYPDEFRLQLSGLAEVKGLSGFQGITEAAARIELSGSSDRFLKNASFEVRTGELLSNLFTLKDQNFQVNFQENLWSFRKVQDSNPLDLVIVYDRLGTGFTLDFRSENFVPSSLISLRAGMSAFSPWLSSRLNLKSRLRFASDGQLKDYQLEGNVRMSNIYLPAPVSIRGKVWGNRDLAGFEDFFIGSQENSLSFDGDVDLADLLPSGTIVLQHFAVPGSRVLSGRFLAERIGKTVSLRAPEVTYGSLSFIDMKGRWMKQGPGYDFDWNVQLQDGYSAAPRFLEAQGRLGWQKSFFLDLKMRWENIPLRGLVANFLPADFLSSEARQMLSPFQLYASWELHVNKSQFLLSPSDFKAVDETNPARRLEFQAEFAQGRLEMTAIKAGWDAFRTEGEVLADLSNPGRLNITTDFEAFKNHYSLRVEVSPEERLARWQGSYNFGGSVSWEEKDRVDFRAWTESFPIPLEGEDVSLSFDVDGSLEDSSWELFFNRLVLVGSHWGPFQDFLISAEGWLSPRGGYLSRLAFSDKTSSLIGKVDFSRTGDSPGLLKAEFNLDSLKTQESYRANLSWDGVKWEGRLQASASPLSRWPFVPIQGNLSALATFSGTWENPSAELRLNLPEGRLNNDSLSLGLSLAYAANTVEIREGSLKYLGHTLTGVKGKLDLEQGLVSVASRYRGILGQNSAEAVLGLESNFRQSLTVGSIESLFSERITGVFSVKDIRWNQARKDDFILNFAKVKNITTFQGGPANFLLGRLTDEGGFKILLNAPAPVTLAAEGVFKGTNMEALLSDVSINAETLKSVLNTPYLNLQDGRLTGRVRIVGPLNDPDFYGDFVAQGWRMGSSFLAGTAGPFSSRISLNDKVVTLEKTSIPVSEGGVLEAQGSFVLDHYGLDRFLLKFESLDPLAVSYVLTGLEATGMVSGRFQLSGNSFNAKMEGDLNIQDANVTLKNSTTNSGGGSDYGFGVDLRLTTGKRVEFLWPTAAFPLLKAFAASGQTLSIRVDEKNGDFVLLGDVKIRGGEINYFNNSFLLKEGQIGFNENKNRFDPRLSITAELRRRDSEGPVTVFLKVDDFLSRFSPRFEASPPRSPEQLSALVGSTLNLPEEYTRNTDLNTLVGMASDVGTSILLKPFEDAVKKTFSLDLFTFKTQVIKHAVLGNQSQTPISLEDYLDNTGLFLGKYLGDDVFFEGLVNLKATKINPQSQDPAKKLDFEVELGLEFQTPFFLLNWRLSPQTPQKLFFTDNTVSFSWRLTF